MVGGEIRVEGYVVDTLLLTVPSLFEPTLVSCRKGVGSAWVYGGGNTLILPAKLNHQHAPVRKELDGGRKIEAGREDVVLKGAC